MKCFIVSVFWCSMFFFGYIWGNVSQDYDFQVQARIDVRDYKEIENLLEKGEVEDAKRLIDSYVDLRGIIYQADFLDFSQNSKNKGKNFQ